MIIKQLYSLGFFFPLRLYRRTRRMSRVVVVIVVFGCRGDGGGEGPPEQLVDIVIGRRSAGSSREHGPERCKKTTENLKGKEK